jgi:hypothetical protein
MPFEISVQFDRVGACFLAGETVTGAVIVKTDSSQSCKSMALHVRGAVDAKSLASRHQQGIFERLQEDLRPYVMIALTIPLGGGGSLKFPAGSTELPFSFPLTATLKTKDGVPVPLIETYNGVFVVCKYEVKSAVQFTFQNQVSPSKEVFVVCPGQSENDVFSMPSLLSLLHRASKDEAAASDRKPLSIEERDHGTGFAFDFTSAMARRSRKALDTPMPDFHIVGALDKVHIDIDTQLSGFIRVVKCDTPITSVEIQLARCESCASETRQEKGREITEVQNIQIGDGNVLRGDWDIPIFMKFPRWYTCPAIRTPNLRVDFEISLVVTFEGRVQVSQVIPVRLYRSGKKIMQ